MPSVAVGFAESALSDLEAISAWYADQGLPQGGARLVEGIFERVGALAIHPDMGRVVPEFGQPFLRELIYPPFRIVYRHDPDRVRVVRMWRGERLLRPPPGEDSNPGDRGRRR